MAMNDAFIKAFSDKNEDYKQAFNEVLLQEIDYKKQPTDYATMPPKPDITAEQMDDIYGSSCADTSGDKRNKRKNSKKSN